MAIARIQDSEAALLLYSPGNQTVTIPVGTSVQFQAPSGSLFTIASTNSSAGSVGVSGAITLQSVTGAASLASQKLVLVGTSATAVLQTDASTNLVFLPPSGSGGVKLTAGGSTEIVGPGLFDQSIAKLNGAATSGALGVSGIFAGSLGVSLGTLSTTVATYLPTSAAGQQFAIKWVLSAAGNSTPTLSVAWTDPKAGSQTATLFSNPMTTGTTQNGIYTVYASNSAAISVTGLETVPGDVYATANISQDQ